MKEDSFLKQLSRSLGPGFITGAADDDPSGIATYSQTGSMFGFSQLWTALFSYPFMTVMQEMCGRIGLVTGMGLSGIIRKHYSRPLLYGAVLFLLVANIINIGADLGAMAAAIMLLIPAPFLRYCFL
jgi:NRAMP (natural resistance-associated macrophage protein)-like metal ion transporter